VKLSVLLPCCDEAENIDRLESDLLPILKEIEGGAEIVAVDDGSADSTRRRLESLARGRKDIRVLAHAHNQGLGAALRTGITAARGDWTVPLDADMSFHPRHIPALFAAQHETGADCVLGSPMRGGMPGVPWSRQFPSLLLNAFYRGLFDTRLSAYTPMFRLYRSRILQALDLRSDGFEISVEILARLLEARRKVVEIPVPLGARSAGVSKLARWRELRNHALLAWRLRSAVRA